MSSGDCNASFHKAVKIAPLSGELAQGAYRDDVEGLVGHIFCMSDRLETSRGTTVAVSSGYEILTIDPAMEKRMKTTTFSVLLAACLMTGAPLAHAQKTTEAASTTAANPLSDADKAFVQAASTSSSTEIDAGKLAMSHSSDKDVKSFARHMMMDHTKLTMELKTAAPKGVTVPTDNSDTALLDTLKPLKGKDFDNAYISKVGVDGHKQALGAFQKEISDGQNADLKKAAQKALPTIQEHAQMAQDLAKKKGVTAD